MAKMKLVISMFTFGTIGIFVKYIPLSSAMIALVRGAIGCLFLLFAVFILKKRISPQAIRKNLLLLILSGAAIGINWILLFEAYHYTTVATATLCYYLAPVFVILLSPFILKERLSRKKILCVAGALAGMLMISGVGKSGFAGIKDGRGILLGICAALFYAGVVLMNKFLKDISAYDSTIMQLAAATAVIFPYVLLTEGMEKPPLTVPVLLLLLTVGIVHTGIGYCLYFSSLAELKAQTAAIFSYIDPVTAILLSGFLLKESMSALSIAGAVLILGSTLYSELS